MASRFRRDKPVTTCSISQHDGAYDNSDSIDEEAGKGKKSGHHVPYRSLSMHAFRRFCLKQRSRLIRAAPYSTAASSTKGIVLAAPRAWHRNNKSLLVLLFVCISLYWTMPQRYHSPRHASTRSLGQQMPLMVILFDENYLSSPLFQSLSSLKPLQRSDERDYNGLVFESLRNASLSSFRRQIASDDYTRNEEYRKKVIRKATTSTYFDDIYYQHPEEVLSLECQPQNWQGLYFPNCNHFHEFDLGWDDRRSHPTKDGSDVRDSLLFSGAFRDAWLLKRFLARNSIELTVLKTLRFKRKFGIENVKGTQRDAVVMERLTSSPRIINIYGHCATSTMVEAMRRELEEYVVPGEGMAKQKDLDEFDDVHPMNNYTIEEKLDIALQMAESLADLHGYKGGVIVHDDVQLCQWLEASNGRLKLGDFNRAEIMEWNENNKSYCKHSNGYGAGNYRAPEEFKDDWLDEKIDVFSFGNNLYGLLTGLWVFYENDDYDAVQEKVIAGERAYIDDRYRNHSYIEGKLVELMERCWIQDPDKRADIFEAVRFLQEVMEESKKGDAVVS